MNKVLLPPIVWLAFIAGMLLAHEYLPLTHAEPTTWRTVVGLLLACLSLGITVWHKRLFQSVSTNVDTFGEPDRLVDTGLFRYVRNPMYLGFVSSLAALAFVMGALSPWVFVFGFFLLANFWYIPFEERAMRSRFGERYDAYCSRTRRWV